MRLFLMLIFMLGIIFNSIFKSVVATDFSDYNLEYDIVDFSGEYIDLFASNIMTTVNLNPFDTIVSPIYYLSNDHKNTHLIANIGGNNNLYWDINFTNGSSIEYGIENIANFTVNITGELNLFRQVSLLGAADKINKLYITGSDNLFISVLVGDYVIAEASDSAKDNIFIDIIVGSHGEFILKDFILYRPLTSPLNAIRSGLTNMGGVVTTGDITLYSFYSDLEAIIYQRIDNHKGGVMTLGKLSWVRYTSDADYANLFIMNEGSLTIDQLPNNLAGGFSLEKARLDIVSASNATITINGADETAITKLTMYNKASFIYDLTNTATTNSRSASALSIVDFDNVVDNDDGGVLVLKNSVINIDQYKSQNGSLIIHQSAKQSSSNLSINEVLESSNDTVKYVFELSVLDILETKQDDFLTVAEGIIIEDPNTLIGELTIGGIPIANNLAGHLSFQVLDAQDGQIIRAIITKDLNPETLLDQAFSDKYIGFIDHINYIDLLGHSFPDSEAINDLNDALAYDIINKSEPTKIASILPVSSEIYLIDIHNTNSVLSENLVAFDPKGLEVLQEDNWFLAVNPISMYDTLKDKGDVIGYKGYKGLSQIILGVRIIDDINSMKLDVIGSVSGGFGKLQSNDDIRDYNIKNLLLGTQVALKASYEGLYSTIFAGYTYSKYTTNRYVTILDVPSSLVLYNNSIKSESEQLAHSILFGLNLGYDVSFSWMDFSPSIYYKGSYIIFEKDYQESGSSGDLYVENLGNTLVSDMGFIVNMDTSFSVAESVDLIPMLKLGVGYRYYDVGDLSYKFVDAKNLDEGSFLGSYGYDGLYVTPGLGITTVIDKEISFGVSYLGNLLLKGSVSHSINMNFLFSW